MQALVLDTETTGLLSNHLRAIERQPYVVEFYGCLVELDTADPPIQELHLLVKPPIKIPEEAVRAHKITDEMLADAPAFEDVAANIKSFIESASLIIAHNLSYDKEIIDIQFERMGQKVAWPACACTVEQTIFMRGHRLKLGELYALLFGELFLDAHRAKNDTLALVRCCRALAAKGLL